MLKFVLCRHIAHWLLLNCTLELLDFNQSLLAVILFGFHQELLSTLLSRISTVKVSKLLRVVPKQLFLFFFAHTVNKASLSEFLFTLLNALCDGEGLLIGIFLRLLLLSDHFIVGFISILEFRVDLVCYGLLLQFGISHSPFLLGVLHLLILFKRFAFEFDLGVS